MSPQLGDDEAPQRVAARRCQAAAGRARRGRAAPRAPAAARRAPRAAAWASFSAARPRLPPGSGWRSSFRLASGSPSISPAMHSATKLTKVLLPLPGSPNSTRCWYWLSAASADRRGSSRPSGASRLRGPGVRTPADSVRSGSLGESTRCTRRTAQLAALCVAGGLGIDAAQPQRRDLGRSAASRYVSRRVLGMGLVSSLGAS